MYKRQFFPSLTAQIVYRNTKKLHGGIVPETVVQFSNDEISMTEGTLSVRFQYRQITKIRETGNLYVLMLGKDSGIILEKNSFTIGKMCISDSCGAILTAVIQSSSASVGILQALSATGSVTYSSAIPIILGQNIGTCVTALISSIGANKNARRAAVVHLYFNLIGTGLFLAVFYLLNGFLHFSFYDQSIDRLGIAVVHTCFNLLSTLTLLPFTKLLEKLAYLTIRDTANDENFQILDERFLASPAVAIHQCQKMAVSMACLLYTSRCV